MTNGASIYTKQFYRELAFGSASSARAIVPLVLSIAPAESVIDIGCGTGEWLAEFAAHGVSRVRGVDGEHVDQSLLRIPQTCFTQADLRTTIHLTERYDVALSLEVAEHLDAQHARQHVELLTQVAPLVVFAAAVPGQGGTHHVNEQWPEYWVDLFDSRGYACADVIRPQLDHRSEAVSYWYAQNVLIFVDRARFAAYPSLTGKLSECAGALSWVHPRLFDRKMQELDRAQQEARKASAELRSLRHTLRRLPGLVVAALKRAVKQHD